MDGRVTVGFRRDLLASALVLSVAAAAWFGWAQADPPSGWAPWLGAGSALSVGLAVVAGVQTWRARRGDSAMADPRNRTVYNVAVAAEVAASLLGVLVLGRWGLAAYLSPWILFVVAAHFIPMGRLFHDRGLLVLAVALMPVAGAAVVSQATGRAAASAVAGGLGGLFMGATALVSLRRAARDASSTPS